MTKQPNPTEPSNQVESVKAVDLIQTPPEPAKHVVESLDPSKTAAAPDPEKNPDPEKPSPGSEQPQPTPEVDSAGVPFDPEKHLAKRHGRTGRWMPRRGKGRRKRSNVASPDPARPFVESSEVKTDPESDDDGPDPYSLAAHSACSILYAIGMTIGGDEWKPTKDEHANLSEAWEAYFRAKGFKDIPPGVAVTIATLSYIGPRMRQPKTLSFLERAAQWTRDTVSGVAGWFRRTLRGRAMPKPPVAQSSHR